MRRGRGLVHVGHAGTDGPARHRFTKVAAYGPALWRAVGPHGPGSDDGEVRHVPRYGAERRRPALSESRLAGPGRAGPCPRPRMWGEGGPIPRRSGRHGWARPASTPDGGRRRRLRLYIVLNTMLQIWQYNINWFNLAVAAKCDTRLYITRMTFYFILLNITIHCHGLSGLYFQIKTHPYVIPFMNKHWQHLPVWISKAQL